MELNAGERGGREDALRRFRIAERERSDRKVSSSGAEHAAFMRHQVRGLRGRDTRVERGLGKRHPYKVTSVFSGVDLFESAKIAACLGDRPDARLFMLVLGGLSCRCTTTSVSALGERSVPPLMRWRPSLIVARAPLCHRERRGDV